MIKKRVGRKREKDELSKSYAIYDSCNRCPLSNYIDLVCNDNLDALIIAGMPPSELLELTRINLIVEFSELSGSSQIKETHHLMREIYFLRAQIEGIRLATCILNTHPDKSIGYFSTIGLKLNPSDDVEKMIKRIKGFSASKVRQYNKALEKYSEQIDDKGEQITEQHFNEQLVALSKHNGFRITKSIRLAEYAAYIKEYSQFISRQEWQRMKA